MTYLGKLYVFKLIISQLRVDQTELVINNKK